ncbi:hypothetical protein GQ53DRAFT_769646 [Thozetella sp. PMI_491]|nr:hypothetical protein GQ53DRAFT_769646 [Thozetella sp. PMI_491]
MVALSDVHASNGRISTAIPEGLVAVFVGGTSGVGEYTLKALVKHSPNLRAYIVGRSQESADRILKECKEIAPTTQIKFIQADVSLLNIVDDVCRQIQEKETAINILVTSQGTMAFSKTVATPEGLSLRSCLALHSRMRFILNLLPLLQKATTLRRVVSVLIATCEGPIDTENILGVDFPLRKWRDQVASEETLLLEEAARRAPDVSFIHTLPGVVRSGITRDAEGLGMGIVIRISRLLGPLIETPPAECGERHAFLATSARGSDGEMGSGTYTVDVKGESSPLKVERILATLRQDGTAQKVWDYIEGDFKRITGTTIASFDT